MNNTALGAENKKKQIINFISEAHEKFYSAMIQYLRYLARKYGRMDGRNLRISSKIPIRPQKINQIPRKKRSCRSFVRA